ncbi:MAG: SRPBCC domain-containing protein [Chloroflexi bacterium]|nr:SRPBCC domain-containing protein [Chloroflexota bacterium]
MIVDPKGRLDTTIYLKRTFAAPREKVFRAWTEPERLKKWFAPAGCSAPSAEIELWVGGKYRVGMQFPHEDIFYVSGTYREIEPPARLVFTWRWEKPEKDFGETLVTIEFHDRGNSTEVVLTHERFPTPEIYEQHNQGWNSILDKLAGVIEGKEG